MSEVGEASEVGDVSEQLNNNVLEDKRPSVLSDVILATLRPITQLDMPQLEHIYSSSREEEMKLFPFNEEQKKQFLHMQFTAQHQHYQQHYSGASFDGIYLNDALVGRLYVDRTPEEIRVIDICLLPQCQYQGIGRFFMHQLLQEAQTLQAKLSAHVEHNNPARAWYARLGFSEISDVGAYIFIVKEAC